MLLNSLWMMYLSTMGHGFLMHFYYTYKIWDFFVQTIMSLSLISYIWSGTIWIMFRIMNISSALVSIAELVMTLCHTKRLQMKKKLYKFERNRALPDFHLIRTRKVNTSLIKLSLTLVLFKQSMMLLFKKNTTIPLRNFLCTITLQFVFFGTVCNSCGKKSWKLNTTLCTLQDILPWTAFFKYINGTTIIPSTFTGPLKKLCGNGYQDFSQVEFNTICNSLDILLQG